MPLGGLAMGIQEQKLDRETRVRRIYLKKGASENLKRNIEVNAVSHVGKNVIRRRL